MDDGDDGDDGDAQSEKPLGSAIITAKIFTLMKIFFVSAHFSSSLFSDIASNHSAVNLIVKFSLSGVAVVCYS